MAAEAGLPGSGPGDTRQRRLPRPPLFVLAPARSCSSVVVCMLGQHPQLYGFPELRLFRTSHVDGLLVDPPAGRGIPARERGSGLVRALAQLHDGEQTPGTLDRAWQWLEDRQDWTVVAVLDQLLALVDPLVGVEKSPETSLSDDALNRAEAAYPQARYLHLVRHPWSTVASMTSAWGPLGYWNVEPSRAADYCGRLWLEQHRRIDGLACRVGPERYLRVRAEDVVNEPLAVLPSVCRWLGITDDADDLACMTSPEESAYANPGPPQWTGGFDPAFLRQPKLHTVVVPAGLQAPPSWLVGASTQAEVAALATDFGYAGNDERHVVHSAARLRGLGHYRTTSGSGRHGAQHLQR